MIDDLELEQDVVEGKYDEELSQYLTDDCVLVRRAAAARWRLLKKEQKD